MKIINRNTILLFLVCMNAQAMQFDRCPGDPELEDSSSNVFYGEVVPRRNFITDVMRSTLCPSEKTIADFLQGQNTQEGLCQIEPSNFISIENGNLCFISRADLDASKQKKIQCGLFEQCTIGDLQKACSQRAMPGNGTFNVVEGLDTQWNSWFRRYVDIGALQAQSENCDAVFQVASNFNGLETVSADQNIEDQPLQSYVNDLTQGPAASISAAPGLILRRFFMFYDQEQSKETWPQVISNQVNFLDNLAEVLPVSVAGYAIVPSEPYHVHDSDYLAIKIGYHANVQVTHGFMLSRDEHMFIAHELPHQQINQVFTAAIDFGWTNIELRDNPIAQEWGQQILNAAYEGTLRKAFVEGKQRVFLTLVGGGAFGNDLSWICSAIERMRDFIQDSGLHVTVIWRSSTYDDDNLRMRFAKLVKDSGGVYDQYRENGLYRPRAVV